jgi:hypothetical protein
MLQYKPFSYYYTVFCTRAVWNVVQKYCNLLKYAISRGQEVTYGIRRNVPALFTKRT